jgi:nicotinamide phosphoribosyltransferase
MEGVDRVVFFGLQYFIKEYLMNQWQKNFFDKDVESVVYEYQRRMDRGLGAGKVTTYHIRELHDLGYLPLEIRALPEGSRVNLRVPMFVMYNTNKEFGWLTNYLESVMSSVIWGPCTSATIANEYRGILENYAERTGGSLDFVDFQGHDFSLRGMFGFEASCLSGAGHLLSFIGTDSVPAIDFIEQYYMLMETDQVGGSIPATEHSVMCAGGSEADDEYETIKRLITEIYPSGPVAIVCDTWDFFKVLTETLPRLKDIIMARDGTVVIRPDSGDPADIICGDKSDYEDLPEYEGAVELLWETFGGTTTEKGFKQLDTHIGLIYGDSITLDRCRDICSRLSYKGFASTNVVLGIGSYSYQYNTRDTFGFALKTTYCEIDGKPMEIFKKPKTDDGEKNSAKGLTAVYTNGDGYRLRDQATWGEVRNCAFELVYKDGVLVRNEDIADIREHLRSQR